MCGFVGIVYFDKEKQVDINRLVKMNNVQHHRGPDEDGVFVENNIGFGFKRLSIIDLKSGQQPMCEASKNFWIVFNGEIYNYIELRQDLLSKGYQFNNNSDTEVILNCYREYGFDCVSKLRGMFSFVIWDSMGNKLFLARDRFGIKPLHYIIFRDGIAFSSELKALVESNFSQRIVDSNAVDSFFTYGYILSPHTIYADIKKLPASHTLEVKLGKEYKVCEPIKYWHPTFIADESLNFNEYSELIIEKLRDSIRKHLISDVPVGAFLSGGIDSSTVVSIAASIYPGKLKTFTIGFEEERYNEANLARITSKMYGTDHHELMISKSSALSLEKIIGLYDEPFNDSSAIPTYFVSKLAAEHVKVVLSGDGGDEFFGGYDSYRRLLMMRKFRLPHFVKLPLFKALSQLMPATFRGKRFLYRMAQKPQYYYAYFDQVTAYAKNEFFNKDFIKQIKNNPIQQQKIRHIDNSASGDYFSKMMELDIMTYMTDDILTKVDRASMANSLEVRVPIIDHEFFELASKIPIKYKLNQSVGKIILRESFKPLLPEEIYNFPKHGFSIPITQWFKDDLNDFIISNLDSSGSLGNYISSRHIEKLKNMKNRGSLITQIWPLVVFNQWLVNAKQ